jgi:hypothetical protein
MTSLNQGGLKMEDLLEMSNKELERYRILCEVKKNQISQQKCAELL